MWEVLFRVYSWWKKCNHTSHKLCMHLSIKYVYTIKYAVIHSKWTHHILFMYQHVGVCTKVVPFLTSLAYIPCSVMVYWVNGCTISGGKCCCHESRLYSYLGYTCSVLHYNVHILSLLPINAALIMLLCSHLGILTETTFERLRNQNCYSLYKYDSDWKGTCSLKTNDRLLPLWQ